MTLLISLGMLAALTMSPAPKASVPSRATVRDSISRAVSFLDADQIKWKVEKKCLSCHHGTMTLWALGEAKAAGMGVSSSTLADLSRDSLGADSALTRVQAVADPAKPAPDPKFNIVSMSSYNLLMAAPVLDAKGDVAQRGLMNIARDIVQRQQPDGSWLAPPHANGPPPTFESPETMTLWALIGLASAPVYKDFDPKFRMSQQHGHAWLEKNSGAKTPQTLSLLLLLSVRENKPGSERKRVVNDLLKLQQPDGGWSPTSELASDAFITGQALYALNIAGVKADRKEIGKGVAFLVASQTTDGSWPMTPRAHADAKPFKNPSPIVHSATAWATIGLLHSQPSALQQVKPSTTVLPDP